MDIVVVYVDVCGQVARVHAPDGYALRPVVIGGIHESVLDIVDLVVVHLHIVALPEVDSHRSVDYRGAGGNSNIVDDIVGDADIGIGGRLGDHDPGGVRPAAVFGVGNRKSIDSYVT